MLDEEFVTGLKELIPYVCNDSTDDTTDQCPTIKIDPMAERMTGSDFLDEVSMANRYFRVLLGCPGQKNRNS